MKKWYIFNDQIEADIYLPSNYSSPSGEKPTGNGVSKIYAILAEENGIGQPIIDRLTLARDFIYAVQNKEDYGIVVLNNRYKKKKNWITKFMDRIINFI